MTLTSRDVLALVLGLVFGLILLKVQYQYPEFFNVGEPYAEESND